MVEYRDIEGFPGYRVGDDGSVWSCWKRVGRGKGNGKGSRWVHGSEWRRLKARIWSRYGHSGLTLCRDGTRSDHSVHALVCTAFHGPCPAGMECRHLNGDATDNRAENLRWGTRKEQHADAVRHGTATRGERHGLARLSEKSVVLIRTAYDLGLATQTEMARLHGVSLSTIHLIVHRKNWRHVPELPS